MATNKNGEGWFPRYLTAPTQVLWWEMDEVFPFLAMWFLGFVFHMILTLGAVGLFLSWLVIKNKENLPEGFLNNLFYASGFRQIDGYPSYFAKEFKE